MLILAVLVLCCAYFLGAIPVAFIVAKKTRGIDIRTSGSGNVGATNAFRVLGKGPGTIVLVGDVLKGYLASSICFYAGGEFGPELGLAGAIMAMVGHNWPVFLGFKGGKGVATGAGAFLALMPKAILLALVIFISLIYSTRYVSVGSIFASISFPIFAFIFAEPLLYKNTAILAATVIVFRHIPNIKRLLKGTENKIGSKK
jgi:glycerol-3-phosphate acyltransferase PlsY